MNVATTELPGLLVLEPAVHHDERGFFVETYRSDVFGPLRIPPFVQDNHTQSVGGTIRGLHLQRPGMQGKLIRVIEGEIFDVAIDVRRGSPTFARWVGMNLSATNFKQSYLPPGFAHGFCVVSPIAQVVYKCTELYNAGTEIGIAWNDPALGIPWPIKDPILSERDCGHPTLAEQMDKLPSYR